ncbi:XRE family transcriptional regulator [Amycolatopsis jiangsuensis]|uniref:Transcriptional regulator with XRE-family HTH domain n=1 Tax=Amycolatopsis jiangsuensis TaxID=1181879 RepID=A0A840IS22_9PSEU|nr:XRE family transcriptional regulator [Amycolatopsis jiangsuensis]MBB4683958.1 transcriptional regulator with XRE-family HTH domain [Amycolatopsis jiangsuensis]
MSEDWAAVARVINERVQALGWKQRELAARSQVSQAIVREIQNHTVERKRSDRTLEALALALELHPQHLLAVLHGRIPPAPGQPREDMEDAVSARLAVIELRLSEITEQLAGLRADLGAALGNRDEQ